MFKCPNDYRYYMDFSKLRALCKLEPNLNYNTYTNNIQSHLSHKS